MKAVRRIPWILLLLTGVALGTTPVKHYIDQIQATGGSVITVPAGGSWVGGNQVQDKFSGNGTKTAFTLSNTPTAGAAVVCDEDGLAQNQTGDYSVSSATVTEVTAPASGQTLKCVYNKY